MKKFFTGLFTILGISIVLGSLGFCIWCKVKHDTSPVRYIDKKLENKYNQKVKDEVVTENEDGTVTAIINF